jgi:hypothetical protein
VTPRKGSAVCYRPLLPDWAISALRQPLPRTVRPVCDETLESYLWRLAEANGLNPYFFAGYLKDSKKASAPVPADAVITVSGQPANSMRYAILELCTPEQLAGMNVAGRPRPGRSGTQAKCTRCTHARGIYDPVTCWTRREDVVCLRHRRWIPGDRQLDLTRHEAIITANKHHRQLILRRGRAAAVTAFTRASSIVAEWTRRGDYRGRVSEVMARFHGKVWNVSWKDPTVLASQYVPAVALAWILADPGWTALALYPDGNAAFTAEVRRTVEPGYTWNPYPYWRYIEPLARTLLDDREISALRQRGVIPPERRPRETIEADELRRD